MAALCAAGSGGAALGALRPVAAPVGAAYDTGRKLLDTDFVRMDFKDEGRSRTIPAKIYFPTAGDGPFPVIIFSHGLGGTREAYEYLGRQWAANGYVVVHLQHPGSDDSAWKESGARPMEGLRNAANLQNAQDRPKDVKCAIDALAELNKSDPKLKGKLDVTKIGVAGHSFGAQTAMLTAGQELGGGKIAARLTNGLADDRVLAVIAMSESVPMNRNALDEIYANVKVPTFYMTGTLDDSPLGDTAAAERRIPFDHTHASATYLLTLAGGSHMTFAGHVLQSADVSESDEALQVFIRTSSTAFWDAYLKKSDPAKQWLNGEGFKTTLGDKGTLEQQK